MCCQLHVHMVAAARHLLQGSSLMPLIALPAQPGSLSCPACRPKSKVRAKAMAIKMVAQLWADRQAEDYADPEANKGKSVSITVKM